MIKTGLNKARLDKILISTNRLLRRNGLFTDVNETKTVHFWIDTRTAYDRLRVPFYGTGKYRRITSRAFTR